MWNTRRLPSILANLCVVSFGCVGCGGRVVYNPVHITILSQYFHNIILHIIQNIRETITNTFLTIRETKQLYIILSQYNLYIFDLYNTLAILRKSCNLFTIFWHTFAILRKSCVLFSLISCVIITLFTLFSQILHKVFHKYY